MPAQIRIRNFKISLRNFRFVRIIYEVYCLNKSFSFLHSVVNCYFVFFAYSDSNGVHITHVQGNSAGHKASSSQVRGKVLHELHRQFHDQVAKQFFPANSIYYRCNIYQHD